jgi:hypothetical protein
MRTAATVAQMLVRACGLVLITLGILFWTGNAHELIPVHMLVGLLLVLSLWTLAFIGARTGVQPGFVIFAFLWGLLVPVLGVMQDGILVGDLHWLVQVLHLLVGLAAIGQAESLGARIKRLPAVAA